MAGTASRRTHRGRTSLLTRLRHGGVQSLPAILLLVSLVAGWEAWVRVADLKPYLLPAPSRIWDAFLEVRGTLPGHTRTTFNESVAGLAAAAGVGVSLAIVIASVPLVRRAIYPILVVSQTIPMIVLAPLLVIWFGFGFMPKVLVVALVGFFPIVVSTADGLITGADREMVALVRSMGGTRLQILRIVRIPAALPSFFAGLKIAAAYAVTGAVIGEWVGSTSGSGLGILISRSQASYRVDRIFVAIAVISLLSIAFFAAVQLAARLSTPWMFAGTREDSK